MNDIAKRLTDNRLKDFSGLSIEGELPVSEALINDVLQIFTGNIGKVSKEGHSADSSTKESQTDFSEIMNMLDVKEVKIGLKEKKAVLRLEIRKY